MRRSNVKWFFVFVFLHQFCSERVQSVCVVIVTKKNSEKSGPLAAARNIGINSCNNEYETSLNIHCNDPETFGLFRRRKSWRYSLFVKKSVRKYIDCIDPQNYITHCCHNHNHIIKRKSTNLTFCTVLQSRSKLL